MDNKIVVIIVSIGALMILILALRSEKRRKCEVSNRMAGMNLNEKIRAYLLRGCKIEAIRVYRETSGAGLKEAKDYIDQFDSETHRNTEPPAADNSGIDKTLYEEIVMKIRNRDTIHAVRLYREATGSGLKEAKDYVDALVEKLR